MTRDEVPKYHVRISEYGSPGEIASVRRNLTGGAYEGGQNVEFGSVTVRDVSFVGIAFEHLYADGTVFRGCDFSDAVIAGTFGVRHQTRFENCRFERTRMSNVEPGQARFVGCSFEGADIRGWDAAANEFVDCRFSGLVKQCNFWGAPWGEWLEPGNLRPRRAVNEFRGNDFRHADLIDVSFVGGIDIGAQLWPDSPDYVRLDRLPLRLERARAVVVAWTNVDARRDALLMLDVYSEAGFEDQNELFANRWSLDVVPREIAAEVWTILETAI
jgi:uncharacterized protein YjbI with pentapeptide repeats